MGQWPYSYTRRRSESSNFLPMKNTWVLWCWVDTSHSVKTRSYKYRWNVLKCIYALKYFSTFVQMFYITSDFIQSFFCFNWPVWKRNSGWAPCCVALEIWTVQLFCNAKSQEEKWIMQLDSTRFSWVSACLSSARLVFCRSENFILRQTTHETRQTADMKRVRWSAPADAEESHRLGWSSPE